MHSQRPEAHEVAVVGEYPVNAVFPAHGGNLRIEHQVAVRVRPTSHGEKPLQEPQAGTNDLATWSGNEGFDEFRSLSDSRWRTERPVVRYHPHEFRNTEHRKRPTFRTFTQGGQPCGRRLVQFALGPMRLNQDDRVNRNQGRSITS